MMRFSEYISDKDYYIIFKKPFYVMDRSTQRQKNNQTVKTRSQIAHEYGVCRKTFYNWCKEKDLHLPNGLINVKMQEKIYDTFGEPGKAH